MRNCDMASTTFSGVSGNGRKCRKCGEVFSAQNAHKHRNAHEERKLQPQRMSKNILTGDVRVSYPEVLPARMLPWIGAYFRVICPYCNHGQTSHSGIYAPGSLFRCGDCRRDFRLVG